MRELDRRVWLSRLGAVCLGGMIPLSYLASYQYVCFGDPLQTTVTRSVHFDYADSPGSMLTGSPRLALHSLLWGQISPPDKDYKGQGLFKTSPILFFAVLGCFFCPKGSRLFFLMVASVVISHTALIAQVRAPMGGATYDARYLLRIVPLVMVGFALLLDRLRWVRTTRVFGPLSAGLALMVYTMVTLAAVASVRSEEHTSELQSH